MLVCEDPFSRTLRRTALLWLNMYISLQCLTTFAEHTMRYSQDEVSTVMGCSVVCFFDSYFNIRIVEVPQAIYAYRM